MLLYRNWASQSKTASSCGLAAHLFKTSDFEHCSPHHSGLLLSYPKKCLVRFFTSFGTFFLLLFLLEFMIYFVYKLLPRCPLCRFFPVLLSVFTLLPLRCRFIVRHSPVFSVCFGCIMVWQPKVSLPKWTSRIFCFCFWKERTQFICLIISQFELFCIQFETRSNFIILHIYVQFSEHPQYVFLVSFSNISCIYIFVCSFYLCVHFYDRPRLFIIIALLL